ncbi:Sentrin-specific protease 2 [Hordeum vulgare]|nr:Sentrin-specific protease 2 [Hordeum vulgare]
MIDDLINKIVKNENTDDDFVRMTFLVLLGTVIAPVSHEYIPNEYYALVKDKRMISKFNWNEFTLKFFLSEIGKVLEDGRVREWPHGNLALLQRMIEKMNKTGVFYRTGNMEEEEENLYGDINESTNDGAFGHKEFVYQSDKDNYRTPSQGKINKQKDDDEGKVPYYCTPEYLNSFKDDWSDPIEVREVSDKKAVTFLDTNEISSHESGHYNGVDEKVEKGIGKRKCIASRAIKSPFVVVKPIKRAKRSAKAKLFNKVDGKKSSADVDVIKSSVMFLRACERSKKHKATQIFNDGVTDALIAERACQILNRQWIRGDVMNAYSPFLLGEAKDGRYIIPTWRVMWLLEYRKDKNLNGNEYEKVSNSNEPVNRCINEYFKAPKTYMALNKDNTHWVTVVMHKEKEEFQVLDSLMGKELDSTTRKLVEDLRREIGADIAEANATGSVHYPDVSTWPIKTYDMPQQEDG